MLLSSSSFTYNYHGVNMPKTSELRLMALQKTTDTIKFYDPVYDPVFTFAKDLLEEIIETLTTLTSKNELLWDGDTITGFRSVLGDKEITLCVFNNEPPEFTYGAVRLYGYRIGGDCGLDNLINAIYEQKKSSAIKKIGEMETFDLDKRPHPPDVFQHVIERFR